MTAREPTHATAADVRWITFADAGELQRAAGERILRDAARAIDERGRFLVVLSGGTTPRAIYEALRSSTAAWSQWHIFLGDERCLPVDHPDRNSTMARVAWLAHVPIPGRQIHLIPAELGADRAALDYAPVVRDVDRFDLVLLGLGDDGHTASLFPRKDWGQADDAPDVLAVHDAPKPPPDRVSLSAQRLSRTRAALFLVGASKSTVLDRWRAGADLPAAAIRPETGVDVWSETAPHRSATT